MKRILALVLAMVVMTSCTVSAYAEENCPSANYTDVSAQTGWAHTGIDFTISEGLMVGTGKNRFSPQSPTTRATLATVLHRIAGCPEEAAVTDFRDIQKDSWYEKAVNWAGSAGIISGYSQTTFAPNDFLTREQAVTMLYNFAQTYGYSFAEISLYYDKNVQYEMYSDFHHVSSWAIPAMKWALATGVLVGTGTEESPRLSPKAFTTREQVAAILYRFNHIVKWPGKGDAVGTETNTLKVAGLLDSPTYIISDTDVTLLKKLLDDNNWKTTNEFLEYPAAYTVSLEGMKYLFYVKDGAWLSQCGYIMTQKNGEETYGSMTNGNSTIFQRMIDICQSYTPE